MFVPLVRTLQRHLPHARLTWIISEPAYSLVKGMEGIQFVVIEKPRHLKDYWQLRQQFKHQHFDVLIAAQASFRANLIYPCIKAKRKIGYDKRRAKDGHLWFVNESITPGSDHTLEGFLKFAQAMGIMQPEIRWDLPIPSEAYQWAQNQMPQLPYVIINPAASKPERSWLPERYIEVIRYIQQTHHCPVVLTGGPGLHDKELGDVIEKEVDVINLIGQTQPKQLLALIQQASFVICPDTGPSHMAAAVGTPVIALHAVTNAGISGPYTFLDYTVNRYSDAVKHILGKDACPWGTQVHGNEAMKWVTVADVITKIQMLSGLTENTDLFSPNY